MPTDILKLDFNSGASPTQSGWTGSTAQSLVDFTNTHGSYTIRFIASSADTSRDRGALTVNTTPDGYSDLYRDFWKDGDGSWNLEIGGLGASTLYDIRLFAFDKSNRNDDVDFTDVTSGGLGASGTVSNSGSDPTTDNQSSVVLRCQSTSGGIISILVTKNSGAGVNTPCNGLIVSTVDAVGATGHYYRYLLNRRRVHA